MWIDEHHVNHATAVLRNNDITGQFHRVALQMAEVDDTVTHHTGWPSPNDR